MAYFIIFTSRETEIRNKVELKVEAFDTTISKILSLQDFGGKQKHEQNMKEKLEKPCIWAACYQSAAFSQKSKNSLFPSIQILITLLSRSHFWPRLEMEG